MSAMDLEQLEALAVASIASENDAECWFVPLDLEHPAVEMVDVDIAYIVAAKPSVVLELIRELLRARKLISDFNIDH